MKLLKQDKEFHKRVLNSFEKIIYEQMLFGLQKCETSIEVESNESADYNKTMIAVLLDYPELFHINSGSIRFDGRKKTFIPNYEEKKSEYEKKLAECKNRINQMISRIKTPDQWETLLKLNSELIGRIMYMDKGVQSHSIEGVLLNGFGVCDGISKTVKLICEEMDIPCIVIEGSAKHRDQFMDKHAWNAIKIRGAWKYFDFTFDITLQQANPCRTVECVDYFCLLQSEMKKDHFKWATEPVDDGVKMDFFTKKRLIISSQKEMVRFLADNISEYVFKISEKWSDFNVNIALRVFIDNYMEKHNRGCSYEYFFNEVQRTLYLRIN